MNGNAGRLGPRGGRNPPLASPQPHHRFPPSVRNLRAGARILPRGGPRRASPARPPQTRRSPPIGFCRQAGRIPINSSLPPPCRARLFRLVAAGRRSRALPGHPNSRPLSTPATTTNVRDVGRRAPASPHRSQGVFRCVMRPARAYETVPVPPRLGRERSEREGAAAEVLGCRGA